MVDFALVKVTTGGASLNNTTTESQLVFLSLHTFIVVSFFIYGLSKCIIHSLPSQISHLYSCSLLFVLTVSVLGLLSNSVILTVSSSSCTLIITVAVSKNSPSVTITFTVSLCFFSSFKGKRGFKIGSGAEGIFVYLLVKCDLGSLVLTKHGASLPKRLAASPYLPVSLIANPFGTDKASAKLHSLFYSAVSDG